MNPRTKNLVMAGAAVVVVGFVAVNTLFAPPPQVAGTGAVDAGSPQVEASAPGAAIEATGGAASPSAPGVAGESTPPGAVVDPGRRSYALGATDLSGLPPDAAPGARLELWVTWEPPVTEEARLQKLIGDVVLERTIPGAVPEAPVNVLVSVPTGRVSDLIYADTFGKLSVTLPV